jgi:hypothetical protein
MFGTTVDLRTDQYEQESEQFQRESQVKRILCCLDERELQIVAGRFCLTRGQTPLTLKQVGVAMGVSKERIRQIQTRAMGKLRKAAESDGIDFDMPISGTASLPPPQHNPENSFRNRVMVQKERSPQPGLEPSSSHWGTRRGGQ